MNDLTRIELLFNSVETELVRRGALGNVPLLFIGRPAKHFHYLAKAWWNMYHETSCVVNQRDRTAWLRNSSYPAEALDISALAEALQEIRRLVDLKAIGAFRIIDKAEYLTAGTLDLFITYYIEPKNQ